MEINNRLLKDLKRFKFFKSDYQYKEPLKLAKKNHRSEIGCIY